MQTVESDLESLRAEIQQLQHTVNRLTDLSKHQRAESEKLRIKLHHTEAEIDAANRRLDAILGSRTWCTLLWCGRQILNLQATWTGLRGKALMLRSRCAGRWLGTFSSRSDQIEICCDNPVAGRENILRQKAEVRGWACARSGIKRIDILLEGRLLEPVETGIKRSDVFQHLPGFPGSDRSGYRAELDCREFSEGQHELRIVITAKSGLTRTLPVPVFIDHRNEYEIWRAQNRPESRREEIDQGIRLFEITPEISIVTPVFRTPSEYLRRCLDSVRHQYYPYWRHILVDDGSDDADVRKILETAADDPRVQVVFLPKNSGIAAATNEGLRLVQGDFVAFLDHDDELSPDALYEVVNELNRKPEWDVFYSDEDKISPDHRHFDAFFKPDWSPDLLYSVNYICHFLVCRRSVLEQAGGLRVGFDGSQDFDLALRLMEKTTRIRRIPRVLYHWRVSERSTALDIGVKPEASAAGLRALQDHFARTSKEAEALVIFPGHYRVRYLLHEKPNVAVIVPSAGNPLLEEALRGVVDKTDYPNVELVIVDNGRNEKVRRIAAKFRNGRRLKVIDCRSMPFNFSLLCNRGARAATAPYLLFLNDDTRVIHGDWLEAMVEHAQRPEVGAVGCLLLFPDDRIQHAGVVMGLYGLAGHSFRLLDSRQSHYFHLPVLTRNCSAVTGACLLTRAEAFWEVNGFEERELPMAFQDVDLCLKLHERGYRIIYTPHARFYHHESATKTVVAYESEIEYMKKRWEQYIDNDPYYNPNLTRFGEGYTLRV